MHMLQLLFSIILVNFVFPLFFGYGNVCSHYSLWMLMAKQKLLT